MRIVKETKPPSMAIIVDTIFHGEVTVEIPTSHPTKDRIDVIFAHGAMLRVLYGTPSPGPSNAVPPALPLEARKLAEIYVPFATSFITNANIWEE